MRILGVDPGTSVTGWGVVESYGSTMRHIANGCIRTQAKDPLPIRLEKIFRELSKVIILHQPQQASVEAIFVAKNAQSALKLGHARGAAITAISNQGVLVNEYSALQVKKSVVGYGRAEKHQMQEMIRILLCMKKTVPQDAADALASAVCHINNLPQQVLRGIPQ